ncbi:hypothetical protein EAY32_26180, partial [Vibrio anguillarum]|nr:hypothetical protein [Vibrio anguillarum]
NWGTASEWYSNWTNGIGDVSPIMRMALLSSVLTDSSVEISSDEYNMFLTGSLSDIDTFMNEKYGKNTIEYINEDLAMWNYYFDPSENPVIGFGMNFHSSSGMQVDYFTALSENLPSRPLTDE